MSKTYPVYRWNCGKWHKVVGNDPAFMDLSKNVWIACGWRSARGIPERLNVPVDTLPENACAKCFPKQQPTEAANDER